MTNTSTPVWLLRLARLQVTYLLTALAVVGIFWAITGRGPSLAATFTYSFVLGNLTALALDFVKIPYAWRQAPTSVFVYIGLLAILVPIAVMRATAIVCVAVPPVSLPARHVGFVPDVLKACLEISFCGQCLFCARCGP